MTTKHKYQPSQINTYAKLCLVCSKPMSAHKAQRPAAPPQVSFDHWELIRQRDQARAQVADLLARIDRIHDGMRATEKGKGAYMMQLLADKANAEAQVADLLAAARLAIELPEVHDAVMNGRARSMDAINALRTAIARAEKGQS